MTTHDTGASLIREAQEIRRRANAAVKALLKEYGHSSLDILAEVEEDGREEIGVIDASRQGDCHVTVEGIEVKQCELVRITFRDGVTGDTYGGTMANLSADDCALLLREVEEDMEATASGERPYRSL